MRDESSIVRDVQLTIRRELDRLNRKVVELRSVAA